MRVGPQLTFRSASASRYNLNEYKDSTKILNLSENSSTFRTISHPARLRFHAYDY